MIYAITRWWREQREIRYLMRDFRPWTFRAALIMVACVLVIAALFVTLTTAFADELPRTMYVITEKDPLNVRERPNIHSEIVARLERGEEAKVLRVENGWALIQGVGEGGQGWASAKYLADKPPIRELTFTVEED